MKQYKESTRQNTRVTRRHKAKYSPKITEKCRKISEHHKCVHATNPNKIYIILIYGLVSCTYVFTDFPDSNSVLRSGFRRVLCIASCLANSILRLDINLRKCFAIIVSYLVITILTSIAWYIDMWMSCYHHYMPNNCYSAFLIHDVSLCELIYDMRVIL